MFGPNPAVIYSGAKWSWPNPNWHQRLLETICCLIALLMTSSFTLLLIELDRLVDVRRIGFILPFINGTCWDIFQNNGSYMWCNCTGARPVVNFFRRIDLHYCMLSHPITFSVPWALCHFLTSYGENGIGWKLSLDDGSLWRTLRWMIHSIPLAEHPYLNQIVGLNHSRTMPELTRIFTANYSSSKLHIG